MAAVLKSASRTPRPAVSAAGSASASLADPAGLPSGLSLRAKGALAVAVLLLYTLLILLTVGWLWEQAEATGHQIEALHGRETQVEILQASLSHAIINLQDAMRSGNPKDLDTDVALFLSDAQRLHAFYPTLAPLSERVAQDMADLGRDMGRQAANSLRAGLERMGAEVTTISTDVHDAKNLLVKQQLQQQRRIAAVGGGMMLAGVALIGAMALLFFKRLTQDIRQLNARAVQIVSGYDGPPLVISRADEVGGLMAALNHTQRTLHERENQIELARRERFYQEERAAIGSLAAGVAHEINNPIAAIAGIAQQIKENTQACGCTVGGCRPELILEQTTRIAGISRQLAEFASFPSETPELLDLNGLVERTTSFIGYDKRFRGIELTLDLDRALPAIEAVAGHLTQVLMNLLINSADALENARDRRRAIRVSTHAATGEVELCVGDNGHGMDRGLLEKVFDEAFTTKPRGKGRGLGLFLCRELIEQRGGRIELESTPGVGTIARMVLPIVRPIGA